MHVFSILHMNYYGRTLIKLHEFVQNPNSHKIRDWGNGCKLQICGPLGWLVILTLFYLQINNFNQLLPCHLFL
jgi:hypothetical protein